MFLPLLTLKKLIPAGATFKRVAFFKKWFNERIVKVCDFFGTAFIAVSINALHIMLAYIGSDDVVIINYLLLPIKEAQSTECLGKYVDGISQNLQNLSPY